MTERIDKILANAGLGTRRDVKRILHSGSVTINGMTIRAHNTQVDAEQDEIIVDGVKLEFEKEAYLMMNKSAGTVCSNREGERTSVFELLDAQYRTPYFLSRLHLVGRLDLDTEGLLIFTTDGALTHKIISPKSRCPKKYFVRLAAPLPEDEQRTMQEDFSRGFEIPSDGSEAAFMSLPARLEFTQTPNEVFLTISEGKYHQVKRMFAVFGAEVEYLKRVQIGGLPLDPALAPGEYRKLTAEEIALLG